MKLLGDIFNFFLLQPIINLVVLILYGLQSLHVPGAAGFSIILLTVVISLVTWPFRTKQIKSAKLMSEKMAELRPRINELKEKHKGDKLKFSQAQADLLKEHGVNPAAGCLPSIIPLLLIIPLYQVIFAFFEGAKGLEKINYFLYSKSWHLSAIPDLNFFGVNLATKPSDFATAGVFVLIVPLITAFLTLIQSLMMSPKKVKLYKSDSPKEVKEKEESEDMSVAMQKQMIFMMPVMIGFAAFSFPVGLALYWNTLTILGVIQQYKVSGLGSLEQWIDKIKTYKKSAIS